MDIELLAPSGDMKALMAAVENGADAVYLGGKVFNARQYAGNFDNDDMIKAVEYCHIRGVKVFVTLNVLLKDLELLSLPEYITFLYNIGVNALIIQDLGVGKLIKDIIPDFELHASTQMTAHNLESVNLLYDWGYKRVVLSRELSLKEIEYITKNTKAEIEVFTHGALCICYSGQCLMSSMIGGRSGNRGRCAQPCRQYYNLKAGGKDFKGYVMSPRDLSTIEHIGLLINTGIKSLKVEGRMKRPEYVAAVIWAYRRAIDSFKRYGRVDITEDDKQNLLKVFNRGGFTTAHLFEKGRSEMISFERPKNWGVKIGKVINVLQNKKFIEIQLEGRLSKGDGIEIWTKYGDNIGYTVDKMMIGGRASDNACAGDRVLLEYRGGTKNDMVYKTYDAEMMKSLAKSYNSGRPVRKVPVDFYVSIKRNQPSVINLMDMDGNNIAVQGPEPLDAVNVELTKERIIDQVCKLGNTPYEANSIKVELDPGLSLSSGDLNALRRNAVDEVTRARINMHKSVEIQVHDVSSKMKAILSNKQKKNKKTPRISVFLNDLHLIDDVIDAGADIVIFGGDRLRGAYFDYKKAVEKCRSRGIPIYIASPRIMKGEFDMIMEEMEKAAGYGADGIYADNLGVLKTAVSKGIDWAAGYSLNIFNYASASMLKDMGCRFVSLSSELSLKDIKHIAPYIENCEALCYGRIEMMVSEYCLVGAVHGCTGENKKHVCENEEILLKDKMGMVFPVKTDIYCRSHIYNSKVLSMLENLKDVLAAGVDIVRLNVLSESSDVAAEIVRAFKERIELLEKGIDSIPDSIAYVIEYINGLGHTKGHYYRGVD